MEGAPRIVIIENQKEKYGVVGEEIAPGIYVVVPVDDPYAQEGTYDYQGAEKSHHWVHEPEQEDQFPTANPT